MSVFKLFMAPDLSGDNI